LALVGAIWAVCWHSPAIWRTTGIGESPVPYLDLYGSLAAGERAATGGNPYELNPLDPFNRPHLYSSGWLVTGKWGLTRNDTMWLGHLLTGLSLLTAVLLIRPHTFVQTGEAALFLASPAFLMAVNRGNNDWVIFILIGGALSLFHAARNPLRLAAAALLAVTAVLKYYPLASVVVLLTARTKREWLRLNLVFFGTLLLALPTSIEGLAAASRYTPGPEGLYAFGAPILFRSFGLSANAGSLVAAVFIFGGAWWMLRFRLHPTAPAGPGADSDRAALACGSALLTGCFFLGASYVYKFIFATLVLPTFWRDRALGQAQGCIGAVRWVLPFVLWLEGIMAILINLGISPLAPTLALPAVNATIIMAQLATWYVMSALVAVLLDYVRHHLRRLWDSPVDRSTRMPDPWTAQP